jgi:hypothetical protein
MDAIIPKDDEEMSARLRERWRFDQDHDNCRKFKKM